MKKVRNERAYKQSIVLPKVDGEEQIRIGLAPGLNRVSDEDWAAVMENEKGRAYAERLRDEGVIDYDDDDDDDDDDDAPKKKKSSKKKSSKKKSKKKGSSEIDGL